MDRALCEKLIADEYVVRNQRELQPTPKAFSLLTLLLVVSSAGTALAQSAAEAILLARPEDIVATFVGGRPVYQAPSGGASPA